MENTAAAVVANAAAANFLLLIIFLLLNKLWILIVAASSQRRTYGRHGNREPKYLQKMFTKLSRDLSSPLPHSQNHHDRQDRAASLVRSSADKQANARSSTNPGGHISTLYAFRQLVDPVPALTESESTSYRLTERVYGNTANGTCVVGSATYTQHVLQDAQAAYAQNPFANQDGTAGTWHHVYATPSDCYDTRQTNPYHPWNCSQ